jgi:four helix bundle protein
MNEQGHRRLKVWQVAMDLAARVHGHTKGFPKDELYGLTSQLRRAAVSVPSNIAEGYGRGGLDYARFIDIAYGSLLELETQIELAERFGYIAATETAPLLAQTAELGRMLNGLRRSIRNQGSGASIRVQEEATPYHADALEAPSKLSAPTSEP